MTHPARDPREHAARSQMLLIAAGGLLPAALLCAAVALLDLPLYLLLVVPVVLAQVAVLLRARARGIADEGRTPPPAG